MNRRDWLRKGPLGAVALVLGGYAALEHKVEAPVEPITFDTLPEGAQGNVLVQTVGGKVYWSPVLTIKNTPYYQLPASIMFDPNHGWYGSGLL